MKKILKFLFIIGPCLFLFNTGNVSAATISAHDVTMNKSGLPTVLSVSTTGNRFLLDASIRSAYFDYKYAILTICSNIGFDVNVYNPSYNYYFNDESYLSNTGKTCTTQGYSGTSYNLYLSVGKFDIGNGNSSYYLVSSYLDFKSTWGYNGYLTVQDFVFSNEDYSISAQKDDKINSSINDVNNSINSDDSDTSSSKCGVICKLKGIFTGIIELPAKLVKLLIDGLKSLFVPTDDQLYEIINDSSELAENFGFVGESVNFFLNVFTSLLGLVNANGCIQLPEMTIGSTSLFDSFTFWESQQVCLNDNAILSHNIDTIRTITSIALVCLFVNFASSKFHSILSKNDNMQTNNDVSNLDRS